MHCILIYSNYNFVIIQLSRLASMSYCRWSDLYPTYLM